MIFELFLALQLLDDVKQRDGIASSDTQDTLTEGALERGKKGFGL